MAARRLGLTIVMWLCALVVGLALSSAPAFAGESPESGEATAITSTTATLTGGVLNPHSPGEAGVYYYSYKQSVTACEGGSNTPEPPEAELGKEKESVPAVQLTGLEPGAHYTFCLIELSEGGEMNVGAPVTFITQAVAPTIVAESESTIEVTATSAKLLAQVNPGGAETTYRFEYGPTSAYGETTAESAPVGADDAEHPAVSAIQGLTASTTYHYRVVATNSQSPAGGTPGPDETFTTQPVGSGFVLPDGRQYELVSPPQKDGAEIEGIGGGGVTPGGGDATQTSESGTSVTYIASAPVGTTPPGNTLSTQIFSTRGGSGWSSQDIAIPHKNPIGLNHLLEEGEEYARFSSDLSRALIVSPHSVAEPSLDPELHQEVRGGLRTGNQYMNEEIYLRNDDTGAFQALIKSEPLPKVELEGATPDLAEVVFEGPAGLDPKYPGAGDLYEWVNGHIQLVDVLPNGEPASGESVLASSFHGPFKFAASATRNAISEDGARIAWIGPEGALFTRDMNTGSTIEIDSPQGGNGAGGGGIFQGANSTGTRIFFTDSSELTAGAPAGGLFMFDVDSGKLTALTTDASGGRTLTGSRENGFFTVNGEGTLAYEISQAVLPSQANVHGEVATSGAPNLYVLREASDGSWTVSFVTSGLEEAPNSSLESEGPLVRQTERISPNGRFLAFMSRDNLTGYDNRDVSSGERDEEVYLYDAESNRLVCASCNPTGARPDGQVDTGSFPGTPMDPWRMWAGYWLAASIPGWTPNGSAATTGYQPRFLSNSGRLFFDSADALVPQDVDGRDDVYEYEPEGRAGCQPSVHRPTGSDVLSAAADGCVGLISAGTGSGDSVFFDASGSGDDVFFTTQDGLVPVDTDGAGDMYDAHVCTQLEPCLGSVEVSPPCTTTDSCRVAPGPQPGVFAPPASATFSGAGNVSGSSSKTVSVKAKTRTVAQIRVQKLEKALQACMRKPKRKRAACIRHARKLYGKDKTNGRRVK